jgi:hypothetical protein
MVGISINKFLSMISIDWWTQLPVAIISSVTRWVPLRIIGGAFACSLEKNKLEVSLISIRTYPFSSPFDQPLLVSSAIDVRPNFCFDDVAIYNRIYFASKE